MPGQGEPFFTADLHIAHRNIIGYENRPFASLREMHEAFVQAWNTTVHPGSRVYILGDVCFYRKSEHEEILSTIARLNGSLYVVEGNHDHTSKWPEDLKAQFHWIRWYETLSIKGRGSKGHPLFLVLFHHPIETWNRKHHGAVHLHGDSHGHSRPQVGRFDVGIDVAARELGVYRPFSLDEALHFAQIDRHWQTNTPKHAD